MKEPRIGKDVPGSDKEKPIMEPDNPQDRFETLPDGHFLITKLDMQPETLEDLNKTLEKIDQTTDSSKSSIETAKQQIEEMGGRLEKLKVLRERIVKIYKEKFDDDARDEANVMDKNPSRRIGIDPELFQPERLTVLGPSELKEFDGWRIGAAFAEIKNRYGDSYEFPDQEYMNNIYHLIDSLEKTNKPYPAEVLPEAFRDKNSSFLFIPTDFEDRPYDKEKIDPRYMHPLRQIDPSYFSLGWPNPNTFSLTEPWYMIRRTFDSKFMRVVLLKKK